MMNDGTTIEQAGLFDKSRVREALLNYAAEAFLVLFAFGIYRFCPYYVNFLSIGAKNILLGLLCAYLVFGLFYHLLRGYKTKSKYRKCLADLTAYLSGRIPKLDGATKTVLLFLLVKFYFIPLMLNFTVNNFGHSAALIKTLAGGAWQGRIFYDNVFKTAMALIFLVDTLYFMFGYLVESGRLGNTVRSVEPTIIGWAAALACYPPFNGMMDLFIPWLRNEMVTFADPVFTLVARVMVVILILIYLWATLALGTKCSNLTNRGIVGKGPYAFVRHPAYIAKNAAWWIMAIPFFGYRNMVGLLCWGFIYYMRAITEERHLLKDPEYQEYCKKVKWRFVPFVY